MSGGSHSTQTAERAVVGSLLINPGAFWEIELTSGDLRYPATRAAYVAIAELIAEGDPVDHISVAARAGIDSAELTQCMRAATAPDRIATYAEIVTEAALDSRVRRYAQALGRSDKRGGDLLALAQSELLQLGGDSQGPRDASHVGDVSSRIVDEVERRRRGEQPRDSVLLSGVPPLDDFMALGPGGVMTLAGRPSMGKTAFVLWLIGQLVEQGERVLVFSTESGRRDIVHRLHASLCGLSHQVVTRSRLGDQSAAALHAAHDLLRGWPVWIDDQRVDIRNIARQIRRYKARHGISVVVVDHLQECHASDIRARDPRGEINAVITGLRDVAREDPRVVVLVLSQLNRGVEQREDKRPLISDLRESGKIEEASDMIVLLYRPAWYYPQPRPPRDHSTGKPEKNWTPSEIDLKRHRERLIAAVAKNRNGPTGVLRCKWDPLRGQVAGIFDDDFELWGWPRTIDDYVHTADEQDVPPPTREPPPKREPEQGALL